MTDRIRLPGFGEDDFLARPGRWSRLALLHRHQVADIGENRFEVRHLRALWGRTEPLTVPEPAVRGLAGTRAVGAGTRGLRTRRARRRRR